MLITPRFSLIAIASPFPYKHINSAIYTQNFTATSATSATLPSHPALQARSQMLHSLKIATNCHKLPQTPIRSSIHQSITGTHRHNCNIVTFAPSRPFRSRSINVTDLQIVTNCNKLQHSFFLASRVLGTVRQYHQYMIHS
jgi:hypothetical protein